MDFDAGAMRDLMDVKGKEERKALFNVVEKLMQLGPRLAVPHAKPLKGEPGLWELRPRQGSSKCRPVFVRLGDQYLILAISIDHARDMDQCLVAARERLEGRNLA